MKSITEFLYESLENNQENIMLEAEIKSDEDFRKFAEDKFKKAFGDKLDEKKMNDVIDGLIKDHKDGEDWGSTIGKLNKSFGK